MSKPKWKLPDKHGTLRKLKRALEERPREEPAPLPWEAPTDDFQRLVGQVKALPKERRRSLPPPLVPPPKAEEAESPPPLLFVEEIDGEVFGRQPSVSERWVRKLRSGPLVPFREVDLHGLTRPETKQRLARELPDARAAGVRSLVVICGRGRHSGPGGAVLPDWVVGLLAGPLRFHVTAFCTAPPRFGGQGALLVALRK